MLMFLESSLSLKIDFLFPLSCWKILGNYEYSVLSVSPPPLLGALPLSLWGLWLLTLYLTLHENWKSFLKWNFYLFSEVIRLSLLGGEGWVRKCRSFGKSVRQIVNKIWGQEINVLDVRKKQKGFISKLWEEFFPHVQKTSYFAFMLL